MHLEVEFDDDVSPENATVLAVQIERWMGREFNLQAFVTIHDEGGDLD